MSFRIVRIQDRRDGSFSRTMLPGDYSDFQQAEAAMPTVLAPYKQSAKNDEQGYWWAHDESGAILKFIISGA